MLLPKSPAIRSKALRDSAKGEDCTLNIAGVCSYDSAKTVLCHLNLDSRSRGRGYKTDDLSAAFGCSACHAAMDGDVLSEEDWLFYAARGLVRTQKRWVEMGLIQVKGVKAA